MITTIQYQQFAAYYEEYFNQVYRFVLLRSSRNKDLAFDLTSELFLKALEKFDSFDPTIAEFKSWIFSIARNHLIDFYRMHREHVDIEAVAHELASPNQLAHELNVTHDTAMVVYALKKIPVAQQELIQLKFFAELTNSEIAEVLHKTEGNVRVMLHRAMQNLRHAIANLFTPHHDQEVTRTKFQGIIAH